MESDLSASSVLKKRVDLEIEVIDVEFFVALPTCGLVDGLRSIIIDGGVQRQPSGMSFDGKLAGTLQKGCANPCAPRFGCNE